MPEDVIPETRYRKEGDHWSHAISVDNLDVHVVGDGSDSWQVDSK